MKMLASDINNTDFVGAKNPDSLLNVTFKMMNPEDGWASMEKSQLEGRKCVVYKHNRKTYKLEGKDITEKEYAKLTPAKTKQVDIIMDPYNVPYVEISAPGMANLSKTVEAVRNSHKVRFPQQWAFFEHQEGLTEVDGWKIEEWDYLNEGQVRYIKYLRFYTVEQIANANDHQMQTLGSMGPGLRIEARKAINATTEARMNEIEATKESEMLELKKEIADLKALVKKNG
jgi:hypothetical protein